MPLANTAVNYLHGDQQVDKVYANDVLVWPTATVPAAITLTYDGALNAGNLVGFKVSGGDHEVDWGDGSPVEQLASGVSVTHTYPTTGVFTAVIGTLPGQTITSYQNNGVGPAATVHQPVEIIFDAPDLREININPGGETPPLFPSVPDPDARRHLTRVEFAKPVTLRTGYRTFFYETLLTEVTGSFGVSGDTLTNMFSGCYELTTIPSMDIQNGVTFSYMFEECRNLVTVPVFNTSSGTDFDSMFNLCASLTSIPLFDTSSGTNFLSMFGSCPNLTTIPLLDTSSGITFDYMFMSCTKLASIPLLDLSSGTSFLRMFDSCTALKTVPALNMSSGLTFEAMFQRSGVATVSPLTTSSGTNFSYMFYECQSLTAVPMMDTSKGQNFGNFCYNDDALKTIPALNLSSGTEFGNAFTMLDVIQTNAVFGARYDIGCNNCNAATAYINTFMTNLGTADNSGGQQKCSIGPNPGAAAANKAIATAKGWEVP